MKILFIKNSIPDIQKDTNEFLEWLKKYTPLEVKISQIETNLSLSHKDFGVFYNGQTLWGLSDIKQQLRDIGVVSYGTYHIVFFFHDATLSDKPFGAWTYPNELNGSVFCEIPVKPEWTDGYDIYRMLSHEIIHAFFRLCWWKNIQPPPKDTMDIYDDELWIESLTGNRARNLKELLPYWNVVGTPTQANLIVSIYKGLINAYQLIIKLIMLEKPKTKLELFCLAIQEYEGYFPGSRSYRNNNPGNLKYVGQANAIGADKDNFCIFSNYESGWRALVRQVEIAANGQSKVYSPKDTVLEFFRKYAPQRDNNEPNAYALYISQKVGIEPQSKIKEIL